MIKWREFTDAERDAHREINKRLGLSRHLHRGSYTAWWSVGELVLLGTMPDMDLARRIGRTVNAVRLMRERRRVSRYR